MRTLLTLLFAVFTLMVCGQPAKKYPYRIIRTLTTDLNNDGKTDTINLISSLSIKERNSFNRISIKLAGYEKKIFNTKVYWTVVDSDFLAANKNAINTKLLFLKKTNVHTVILLFGELDAAGYRDAFSIINIEDNQVKMIFDDDGKIDIELPTKLADLDHDGRLDFVYDNYGEFYSYSAKYNADIGTYHPYYVYTIDDAFNLNEELTKKYNEKYYVFVEHYYNGKIEILYPRNGGKPRQYKK